MRLMTARARAAARAGAPWVFLAEIETGPETVEHFWGGLGTLHYAGESWIGIGGIASISGLSSDAAVLVQTITLTLALDEATANAFSADLRGRMARLSIAFLDEHRQIIRDPVEILEMRLDTATQKTDNGTTSFQLVGQTGFTSLEQPSRLLWTNEQQQHDFPGDTGFDRMPGIVAKEITWGPA